MYKLPLGMLALIIPIVALLAANHRSEQTKEQLSLTRQQNTFSNYYKHIEEFEKFCEKNILASKLKIKDPRKLHGLIFSEAKNGDYSATNGFVEGVDGFFKAIISISGGLNDDDQEKWVPAVKKMLDLYSGFMEKYSIEGFPVVTSPNQKIGLPKNSVKEFIIVLVDVAQFIHETLKFDAGYAPSQYLKKFIDFDCADIPESNVQELGDFKRFDLKTMMEKNKGHGTVAFDNRKNQ